MRNKHSIFLGLLDIIFSPFTFFLFFAVLADFFFSKLNYVAICCVFDVINLKPC